MLAVVGRSLPPALRTFLLTLAIVDDLVAIIVIAVFYSVGLAWAPLLGCWSCSLCSGGCSPAGARRAGCGPVRSRRG